MRLHKQGRGIKYISRALKISPRTVRRWRDRYLTSSDCQCLKPPGRPRILTGADASRVLQFLMAEPHKGAEAVAMKVVDEKVLVDKPHKSTITRTAHREALAVGRPIQFIRGAPAKGLSEANKSARLQFAERHSKTNWERFMFTDRTRFEFKYPGEVVYKHTWRYRDEPPPPVRAVNHPQSVNVYAGITMHGSTRAHLVTGTSKLQTSFLNKKGHPARNITAMEYKHVVLDTFLPHGNKLFNTTKEVPAWQWTLQMDNDPTHRDSSVWLQGNSYGAKLLNDWPPNSPDLNPIENFWAWIQDEVNKLGCPNFDQFRDAIIDLVENPPKKLLKSLIRSMKSRLMNVRAVGGARIKY